MYDLLQNEIPLQNGMTSNNCNPKWNDIPQIYKSQNFKFQIPNFNFQINCCCQIDHDPNKLPSIISAFNLGVEKNHQVQEHMATLIPN